ncbi:MAG: SUMF1/EgtB/PvdO family nonheme iron enzyme [Armatimonadetes bacterium]|nr:SUMF1/EgtB/PvdO family nonheme iron enzyme [Armatimonadota bacterium]
MKSVIAVTAVLALLSFSGIVQADITIETVAIGDAGNAAELSGVGAGGTGPDRLCGAVSYSYRMGCFEVTTAQYTEFLNAAAKSDSYGLYDARMTDTGSERPGCNIQRMGTAGEYTYSVGNEWANRPVNYISYWDACRFANWLHNGQGNGDTETGAYTLNGYTGTDGREIVRNPDAQWFLPNEDEWYKAAYYKGNSDAAGFWDYPTCSDSTPSNLAESTDSLNIANFYQDGYAIGEPFWRSTVGEFSNSPSSYGTFDQGGNLWEWIDGVMENRATVERVLRGGSYANYADSLLASQRGNANPADSDSGLVGFRVAAPVPEPSSIIALLGGLAGMFGLRRRK